MSMMSVTMMSVTMMSVTVMSVTVMSVTVMSVTMISAAVAAGINKYALAVLGVRRFDRERNDGEGGK
jgi:hypothetical protein